MERLKQFRERFEQDPFARRIAAEVYSTAVSKTRHPALPEPTRPSAQQKRSLRTADRLLEAASRVLDRDGLEGATVPRIAAAANLSPASIYRRFADKDDLLRATFLQMLEASHDGNATQLRSMVAHDTLSETADGLIDMLLKQYREHPQLLRALSRMLDTYPDSAFAKQAMKIIAANLAQAAEVLLAHRDKIRHPDPEHAVRFALLSATSTIEISAIERASLWRVALPLSDKAFHAELTRQMVGYLRRKP